MVELSKKVLKIISVLLAFMIFMSTVLFLSYEIRELNHDCEGQNCPICYQLKECSELVKNKINYSLLEFCILCIIVFNVVLFTANQQINLKNTLIKLKVEFLD